MAEFTTTSSSQKNNARFKQLKLNCLDIVKIAAPYRTGALKNQIRLENDSIVSDIDYMEYTNEPWGYNPRWGKTLKNKHEFWWNKSAVEVARFIAIQMRGRMK